MQFLEQLNALRQMLLNPQVNSEELQQTLTAARRDQPLPVVWLIGKTQAGKSSIVRALTNDQNALIGNGFQPCTRTLAYFDFPAAAPVVRFLDTRGLGEVTYDPAEDLRWCESQAHLLLGVMRASDPNPQPIFEALAAVRKRHPEWPLIIAQTCLHEFYPDEMEHILPYPFTASEAEWTAQLPTDLGRALVQQRASAPKFAGTPPHWVPIDLTLPEDGYLPAEYGLTELWQVIEQVYQQHLWQQLHGGAEVRDVYSRACHPHIVGYALAAAAMGAVPLVDLAGVPALQAKMLHSIAEIYRQPWDQRTFGEFLGLLGVGIGLGYAARLAGRSLIKLIPVVGQTAGAVWGASASGTMTYALGKAADFYFHRRLLGQECDGQLLRDLFNQQLTEGGALLANQFTGGAKHE